MDDIDDILSVQSGHKSSRGRVQDLDDIESNSNNHTSKLVNNSRGKNKKVETKGIGDDKVNKVQSPHTSVKTDDPKVSQGTRLKSRELNNDEPKPDITPSRDLLRIIQDVEKRANGRIRLPMTSTRNVASVRIMPDISSEDESSSQGKSARTYTPSNYDNPKGLHNRNTHNSARTTTRQLGPQTKRPGNNLSVSERAYIWRMKFIKLNKRNPEIPIPDTNDPDSLERLYIEAVRTDHYCSTSATWLIYMGIGYAGFQYGLNWIGFKLPANFTFIQLQVMSHYPQLLKALGDPGGPSLGSSWPPWIKLLFVIAVHTLIFVLIYKISGSEEVAYNTQKFICRTGFMGGKPQGEEADADSAVANVGGMLGGLGGLFGGSGGGIGNIFQNIMGSLMGAAGRRDNVADIDLDAPPAPVSNRSDRESRNNGGQFNSRRKNPFD